MATLPKVLISRADYRRGCCTRSQNSSTAPTANGTPRAAGMEVLEDFKKGCGTFGGTLLTPVIPYPVQRLGLVGLGGVIPTNLL
jgi:hypothetical protein